MMITWSSNLLYISFFPLGILKLKVVSEVPLKYDNGYENMVIYGADEY